MAFLDRVRVGGNTEGEEERLFTLYCVWEYVIQCKQCVLK